PEILCESVGQTFRQGGPSTALLFFRGSRLRGARLEGHAPAAGGRGWKDRARVERPSHLVVLLSVVEAHGCNVSVRRYGAARRRGGGRGVNQLASGPPRGVVRLRRGGRDGAGEVGGPSGHGRRTVVRQTLDCCTHSDAAREGEGRSGGGGGGG